MPTDGRASSNLQNTYSTAGKVGNLAIELSDLTISVLSYLIALCLELICLAVLFSGLPFMLNRLPGLRFRTRLELSRLVTVLLSDVGIFAPVCRIIRPLRVPAKTLGSPLSILRLYS
jgi:hypothetical protein